MEQKDLQETQDSEKEKSTLIIEAPEYLAFGQNLYDQEPFKSKIAEIQGKLGLQDNELLSELRAEINKTTRSSRYMSGLTPEKRRQIKQWLQKTQEDLYINFPSIFEYLSAERSGYFPDGSRLNSIDEEMYSKIPTRSYAKWIYDKQHRERKMLSTEVRSLIFNETSTSSTANIETSGHRPGWKKWAILKASEITR